MKRLLTQLVRPQEGLRVAFSPGDGEEELIQLLSFGEDYRNYIDSLSDSSSSLKRVRGSRRIKKRNTRRRQVGGEGDRYADSICSCSSLFQFLIGSFVQEILTG